MRERVRELSSTGYFLEAELLPPAVVESGGKTTAGKRVYCHLTPRQLTVKEYFMKIIPRRLYTFRVVPATKMDLESHNFATNGYPVISIDDGYQVYYLLQSCLRDFKIVNRGNFL